MLLQALGVVPFPSSLRLAQDKCDDKSVFRYASSPLTISSPPPYLYHPTPHTAQRFVPLSNHDQAKTTTVTASSPCLRSPPPPPPFANLQLPFPCLKIIIVACLPPILPFLLLVYLLPLLPPPARHHPRRTTTTTTTTRRRTHIHHPFLLLHCLPPGQHPRPPYIPHPPLRARPPPPPASRAHLWEL